ncbi:RICIN domain-containing protein [Tenggerimyces flavus]|uniref:RICIN domain-containing protein n=1 Tax=Tenggerimyces flavus TaxID=1708749 RepID=A0ABV7YED9_9ACTN|nr:RICIN domain-containing protein [Tenggerimyces flavus]MBM7786080.1 hypothetical protein [Tenggerimyces flavus]
MSRAKVSHVVRSLAMLVGTTALAVASFAALGGSASADSTQTFKNQWTKKCLDDSSAHGVRTFTCNGTSYQQWKVHVWGDQTRQLRSNSTGKCLDDSNLGLRTFNCWPGSDARSKFQSWYVHRWNDGTIQFKNQTTGRCLDDTGGKGLRAIKCYAGGSKYQSWY